MRLESFRLKPGDRVRCVDAGTTEFLDVGQEYKVLSRSSHPDMVEIVGGRVGTFGTGYVASRFKPIVRVKAPTRRGCCNKACAGCEDFAFRARLHRFAVSGQ